MALWHKISDYLGVQRAQVRLQLIGWSARFLSQALSFLLVGLFFGFLLLFLGIGFGFWLNELLDSTFVGFFIVAGLYLLLGLLVVVLVKRGHVQTWIEEAMLASIESEESDE